MMEIILIVGAAMLPFLVKLAVLAAGFTGYAWQSLYKIAQLLVPVLWRRQQGAKGLRMLWPIDEPLPSVKIWILAIALAVFLSATGAVAISLLAPFFELDPAALRAGFDARFAVDPLEAIVIVTFLSFANSALEELHFRAWLDRELSRRAGAAVGITVSALAFGGMHALIFAGLPSIPLSLVGLAVLGLAACGACWSLLMRRRGGIHAAWLSHGLTDAMLLGWGLHWLGYF